MGKWFKKQCSEEIYEINDFEKIEEDSNIDEIEFGYGQEGSGDYDVDLEMVFEIKNPNILKNFDRHKFMDWYSKYYGREEEFLDYVIKQKNNLVILQATVVNTYFDIEQEYDHEDTL